MSVVNRCEFSREYSPYHQKWWKGKKQYSDQNFPTKLPLLLLYELNQLSKTEPAITDSLKLLKNCKCTVKYVIRTNQIMQAEGNSLSNYSASLAVKQEKGTYAMDLQNER